MHASRSSVGPRERFTVTVRVVIAEKRDRLDELVLGAVDDCTIVGDERRHAAAPGGGTEFLEVLTLEAGVPGTATISPAYLDAIDSRSGKALRFSTNAVSVRIGSSEPVDRTYQRLLEIARVAVVALGFLAALGAFAAWLRRRPRLQPARPVTEPVAPLPALPPVAPVQPATLATARDSFARSRDERTLLALRAELFVRAGVRPGATLADALAVAGARRALRLALIEAEAAAFGPHDRRTQAGDALLAAVDATIAAGERTA